MTKTNYLHYITITGGTFKITEYSKASTELNIDIADLINEAVADFIKNNNNIAPFWLLEADDNINLYGNKDYYYLDLSLHNLDNYFINTYNLHYNNIIINDIKELELIK